MTVGFYLTGSALDISTGALISMDCATREDDNEADEDDGRETQDDVGKMDGDSLTLQTSPTSPFKRH